MNTYWRSPDPETTAKVFDQVRALGTPYPITVAGRKVLRWRDLTVGYDSNTEDNIPALPSSLDSQMITCWLEEAWEDSGIRFTVRASGTEPKIKSGLIFLWLAAQKLKYDLVYLECQSKNQESAEKGAFNALNLISSEWFSDQRLAIQTR